MKVNNILESEAMGQLSTLVEEATRSTAEGVKYFVEPAGGSLRRAKSRRHHVIFGRRGSGKSSLLRKAASDLTIDRAPIASVDMEPFKGHSYPDLLLSVLIAAFRSVKEWLGAAAVAPATKTTFWQKLFGAVPSKPAYNRKACSDLSAQITQEITKLEEQLHASDAAEIKTTSSSGAEDKVHASVSDGVKTPVADFSSKIAASESRKRGSEM